MDNANTACLELVLQEIAENSFIKQQKTSKVVPNPINIAKRNP